MITELKELPSPEELLGCIKAIQWELEDQKQVSKRRLGLLKDVVFELKSFCEINRVKALTVLQNAEIEIKNSESNQFSSAQSRPNEAAKQDKRQPGAVVW